MPERKFFVPKTRKKKPERGQVVVFLTGTLYLEVKVAAAQNDMSMSEFVRQCVSYALDSMAWKEVGQQENAPDTG